MIDFLVGNHCYFGVIEFFSLATKRLRFILNAYIYLIIYDVQHLNISNCYLQWLLIYAVFEVDTVT